MKKMDDDWDVDMVPSKPATVLRVQALRQATQTVGRLRKPRIVQNRKLSVTPPSDTNSASLTDAREPKPTAPSVPVSQRVQTVPELDDKGAEHILSTDRDSCVLRTQRVISRVRIADTIIGTGHRPLDEQFIETLAASMGISGLIEPVRVFAGRRRQHDAAGGAPEVGRGGEIRLDSHRC